MQFLKGYNLYHRTIVLVLMAIGALGLIRAVLVLDFFTGGAYVVRAEATISQSREALWPWITEPENRSRWTAFVTDVVRMQGDSTAAGSTNMVFWRNERKKRWSALEQVRDVVTDALYQTVQKSDQDSRIWHVSLSGDGCEALVQIEEIIQPAAFSDRFWSFMYLGEKEERLKISLTALQKWVAREPACEG